jgi:hypothetical protein
MHTQINIFLSREIVGDLWFIDDNNLSEDDALADGVRVEGNDLGAHPTKR